MLAVDPVEPGPLDGDVPFVAGPGGLCPPFASGPPRAAAATVAIAAGRLEMFGAGLVQPNPRGERRAKQAQSQLELRSGDE